MQKLEIVRMGQECLAEDAGTAKLTRDAENWSVELLAPCEAFLHELRDEQLVRLRWRAEGTFWEGHARVKIVDPAPEDGPDDLRLQFNGTEAAHLCNTRNAELEKEHNKLLAEVRAAKSIASRE